ncbi:LytTR family transcriptional regulator [Stenotrophomonas maltophilia]|uniref:LytTR family DNA-binding domain-containing protein n=1 Tax=Stenotrophomonas maltophilia TaxID=40324 RepID=UPI0015E0106F|nr:LytTR family DNA-binding domain-containing protein [Stenotrophomonas maltophilia]MBA0282393.1 LytTR family transcriptional regulator [Stenotrophomonas maltophilia]MBA0345613.1 LytTR family transcriptional regulator [Stenotrophomonas maltophilia]MBA0358807.1 LytTR family transcriptional regulator [Stenotrophomonas maltophilia]MBA0520947.1 LytTR family transcriptional regulator [Stenotrophomonas maltophilia]
MGNNGGMENGDSAALTAPVAERTRRPGLAVAFWSLLFLGTAAGNVLAQWMRALRDAQPFSAGTVSIEEFSSALASLGLLALLHAAARRWPLHADTWKRRIGFYVLGGIGWWLLHVSAMVLLRKLAFSLVGQHYTYGDWPAQWFYEFFKDVQTYSLLVIAVHAVAWFGRQRQGEAHLLAEPDDGPPVASVERPQHFLVRKLGKEFLVATADVEYAQAAGNYVNLRVRGHDYPLRITMAVLEQRLDPGEFLRPHRSWLIHRGQLRSIEPLDGGEALLHMADGAKVPCSRRQLPLLRQALGGAGGAGG